MQDIYQRRGSAHLHYQWRKAQIINISGTCVSIHYVDRDSQHDEVLDLQSNYRRIRNTTSEHGDVDGNRPMSKSSTNYFTSDETLSERDDFSRPQSAAGRSNRLGRRKSMQSQQQEQEDEDYYPNTQSGRTPKQRRHPQSPVAVASPSAVYVNIPLASEIIKSEQLFCDRLQRRGLHIVQIEGDGNCLFRAVSHQLFLSENKHEELRAKCVKVYILVVNITEIFF